MAQKRQRTRHGPFGDATTIWRILTPVTGRRSPIAGARFSTGYQMARGKRFRMTPEAVDAGSSGVHGLWYCARGWRAAARRKETHTDGRWPILHGSTLGAVGIPGLRRIPSIPRAGLAGGGAQDQKQYPDSEGDRVYDTRSDSLRSVKAGLSMIKDVGLTRFAIPSPAAPGKAFGRVAMFLISHRHVRMRSRTLGRRRIVWRLRYKRQSN
jgi:hypothetical protein